MLCSAQPRCSSSPSSPHSFLQISLPLSASWVPLSAAKGWRNLRLVRFAVSVDVLAREGQIDNKISAAKNVFLSTPHPLPHLCALPYSQSSSVPLGPLLPHTRFVHPLGPVLFSVPSPSLLCPHPLRAAGELGESPLPKAQED